MEDIELLYRCFEEASAVCIDTRTMAEDCLFFCLSGERFDGNTFAEEALQKGAKYVVIDNPSYKINDACICVPNALEALQQLAVYHRDKLQIPIIGITGTNGKTTTKELVQAVLSEKYSVIATKGNFNNHIGVPLTLLSVTAETEIAIVEMGANHAGEIAFLCEIAKPTMGIITNIGKAHLEGFGAVEKITETKFALYQSVKHRNGLLFVNADDKLLMRLSEGTNRVTYGKKGTVKGSLDDRKLQMEFTLSNHPKPIRTQLTGGYNFYNAMSAAAVGGHFAVPIKKIAHALTDYTPDNSRSQIIKKGKRTLILDAYNANPSSMKLAIENIANMKIENKILLLGQMAELGTMSAEEHQAITDLIQRFSFAKIFLYGEEFLKTNIDKSWVYTDAERMKEYLKHTLPERATILVKGSRSMKMEQFLEVL